MQTTQETTLIFHVINFLLINFIPFCYLVNDFIFFPRKKGQHKEATLYLKYTLEDRLTLSPISVLFFAPSPRFFPLILCLPAVNHYSTQEPNTKAPNPNREKEKRKRSIRN